MITFTFAGKRKKTAIAAAVILLVFAVVAASVFVSSFFVQQEPRYLMMMREELTRDETITFDAISRTQNVIKGGFPNYSVYQPLENCCGAVGGTGIIGFYDTMFPELIPMFDPVAESGNYKSAKEQAVQDVLSKLYTYMRTNVDGPGVSEDDFKTGLVRYVSEQGYALSFEDLKNGKEVSTNAMLAALDRGIPVVLFCKSGYISRLVEYEDRHVLDKMEIRNNHIMIAYGYDKINYFDKNKTRKETFIRVVSGFSQDGRAAIRLNSDIGIINASAAVVKEV